MEEASDVRRNVRAVVISVDRAVLAATGGAAQHFASARSPVSAGARSINARE